MSKQGWEETLITSQGDGTGPSNTTTATSILPAAARYTLPANYFSEPGKQIRVRVAGRQSGAASANNGNITFDVRFGTVASPIVVFNGGATAQNATATTNQTFIFWADLVCRAIGSGTSANMMGIGQWTSRTSLNAPAVGTTTGVGTVNLPDTAPAVGTGFDSTITNVVDVFVTYSIANSGSSITTHQYSLESLN